MSNKKISALTPKGSALSSTDLLEVSVYNGSTYDTKSLTGANVVSGLQPTLVSGTNIKTINSTSILGSGNIVIGGGGLTVGTTAIASGTIGRILFEGTGNVLQQDSTLFWDNTNKRFGLGATPSTSVRLDVRMQGALSTDIGFRVRNSADSADIMAVQGNNLVQIGVRDVLYTPLTEKLLVTGLRNTDVIVKLSGGGTTNPSLTELQLGGINSASLTIGTSFLNPTNRFNSSAQIQCRSNSTTNLIFGNSGANTRGWGFYYTTGSGVTAENQVVTQITRRGTLSLGNTDVREYAESNTLILKTGINPLTNGTDSFKLYSADIVAGNAAPHFRTENGAIIKLYQETTAVTPATVVSGAGGNVKHDDTFDGYTVEQVVRALRNLGNLA